MLKFKKIKEFYGIGRKSSFKEIKNYLSSYGNFAVEMLDSKKIIKLNIPFGEMYLKCTEREWEELKNIIKSIRLNRLN